MKAVVRTGYGLWCWAIFLPIALGALVLALPAPTVQLRRRIARRGARTFFWLAGMRLEVRGLERLPEGACVVVSNHSSYLDGVIMQAALPPRFAFVIKREMVRVPLAGLLLRRLGSEFVERTGGHRGGVDARRVMRAAAGGQSIAVFPEGTFDHRVGMHRFLPGAFVTAARSGMPVVPAAIRGARHILPAELMFPRRGRIDVEILDPIAAEGHPREIAVHLRKAARDALLERVGEPDLEA